MALPSQDFIPVVTALAFAPGVFWLWYFYRRNTCDPEPRALIVRLFLLGMAISFPVAVIETVAGIVLPSVALLAVVIAPIVEESAKFSVVRFTVYRHGQIHQVIDGIVFAAAAALGFASVENSLYLIQAYLSSPTELLTVFPIRAFLSVPGHALFSSMFGYALGRAVFARPGRRGTLIAGGLLLAMVFHSVFNLLLLVQVLIALLILVLGYVPIIWLVANRNIVQALKACTIPFQREKRPE